MMRIPILLLAPAVSPAGAAASAGRIAISRDGNAHDRDDIGAVAMQLALLGRAGLADRGTGDR